MDIRQFQGWLTSNIRARIEQFRTLEGVAPTEEARGVCRAVGKVLQELEEDIFNLNVEAFSGSASQVDR